MAPLVKPVGVGRIPILRRKPRPISAVYCADVDEMPSTALMIAIGSPLTNALGIAGSVGSHAASQFPLPGSRAPGARSQFAAGFPAAAVGGWAAGWPPAGADHLRAASSLACAAARSAVS